MAVCIYLKNSLSYIIENKFHCLQQQKTTSIDMKNKL